MFGVEVLADVFRAAISIPTESLIQKLCQTKFRNWIINRNEYGFQSFNNCEMFGRVSWELHDGQELTGRALADGVGDGRGQGVDAGEGGVLQVGAVLLDRRSRDRGHEHAANPEPANKHVLERIIPTDYFTTPVKFPSHSVSSKIKLNEKDTLENSIPSRTNILLFHPTRFLEHMHVFSYLTKE